MIKINIYAVGSIKEKFFKDAINEYSKRLSKYCKLNIVEINEVKLQSSDDPSKIKEKEGEEILKRVKSSEYLIALDLNKKEYSSEELSNHLSSLIDNGKGEIAFIIGGTIGLGDNIKAKVNESITFSKLTFPHQLIRIFLLEQIYRSFKIMKNESYHH